jgi:thiol-disulfide isomerase/thioredoxin
MLTGYDIGALGFVAGLGLAVVFAAAAVGKLADRDGTRKAVGEFGTPDRLVAPLALLLPVAEIAVALALVFAATRPAGAVSALALLVVFSAAVGVSLARGRTPDCHCFGQLHSAPASWKTLARNALLAGLAVVALTEGGPGAFGWIGDLTPIGLLVLAAGVLATCLIVGGAVAFGSLMRAHGRVLLRLDTVEGALRMAGIEVPGDEHSLSGLGIDPGTPAPAFTAETASGGRASLDDLLEPSLPLLLLFTSPSCGPCQALLPDIARWQREHADQLTIAAMSGGEREAIAGEAEAHGLEHVLIDRDLAVLESFQVNATPSALLISADGQIASYLASGSEEIEQLVERVLASEETETGLPIGTTVPELGLLDLDGMPVSLTDPDRDTLVLFWNPSCGFCRSMLEDLHAWEREDNKRLRLLIASSGDPADTQADHFQSKVALDPGYSAGTAFGAGGTPMAVLIDQQGRVASDLLAGGAAVMELAQEYRDQHVAATS